VAEALAKAGADVAIAATKSSKLEEVAEAVRKTGQRAMTLSVDVTKGSQVKKTVQQVLKEFGRIDILVNAGDIPFFQPFLKIKGGDWNKVFNFNFTSALNFCRAVGRPMLKQKKGRIIHIVSGLGERGMANGSAYCVAMGAVQQLTRALALEWATKGITVNAIGTGWFAEPGQTVDPSLTRYIPGKRYGRPEEVGSLAVYLASDATEFTTGQIMYVDGGLMAHA
jgi:NAD(P)-dependent dehydrogenase (short-subunit alcohol dehydrogenase family)